MSKMKISKYRRHYLASKAIRAEIEKKDIPAYWIEFLMIVADAGETGVTTKEVADEIGMTQGIASRMVKLMSKSYHEPGQGVIAGMDLLVTAPDHIHRQRQRVFLSEKGKRIVDGIPE